MRSILTLLLMMMTGPLFAQRITGKVTDNASGKAIGYAIVTAPGAMVYTNADGSFNITLARTTDTLTVNSMGYRPYHTMLTNKSIKDTLRIPLTQLSIMLKDVNIGGKRDAKLDSLRNRRMFSSVYNYRATTVKDIGFDKNSLTYIPSDQITNTKSTTAIGGVQLLSVLSLLTKNKSTTSKLQKDMIRDEEGSYVDRKFSKQRVGELTKLKGDSLSNFMLKYRPTVEQVRAMSDYDMLMYIKSSYAIFMQK